MFPNFFFVPLQSDMTSELSNELSVKYWLYANIYVFALLGASTVRSSPYLPLNQCENYYNL